MKQSTFVLFALFAALCLLGQLETTHGAIAISGDVDPDDPADWNSDTNAYVGNTGSGSVDVNSGTLRSSDAYIGYQETATGQVTVTGIGSEWANDGFLYVGHYGNGILNITGGGDVNNNITGYLGYYSGSTGVAHVNGSGSTWTNDGNLYVGYYGNGTLNITDGGAVTVDHDNYVGYRESATGTVNFGSTGGTLTTRSLLAPARELMGTGTINTRGLVSDVDLVFDSTHGLTQTLILSSQPDQNVTIHLDMSGGSGSSRYLGAGYRGNGSLTIQDGISVSCFEGYLGYHSGSTGEATVSGTDSIWTNDHCLYVGYKGNGTLNITGGGAVTAAYSTNVSSYESSTGTINFGTAGGTLTTKSLLAPTSQLTGTGTINTCGLVSDVDLVFDSTHGLTQTLILNSLPDQNVTIHLDMSGGSGSNGQLGAGYRSNGSLTIQDGISVSCRYAFLGYHSGSTGVAHISGSGSTWTNDLHPFIGYNGNGTLNITGGGAASNRCGVLGYRSGSTGMAHINGSGSTWTNSDGLFVGYYGNGTLNITGGGSVSNSRGYVGYYSGSTGEVTVSGSGSTWANNDDLYYGDLFVGLSGSGTLNITDGGLVRVAGTLTIDYYSGDDSFVNTSTGGMLALRGYADDSLTDFLDLIDGTDAIRYWDESIIDWADITGATPGTDYTLAYIGDAGSDLYGYTVLTVGTILMPGDANGDNVVDETDALRLAANWGQSGHWSTGDFDGDGVIGPADAAILAANWGYGTDSSSESSAVPEPGVLVALLIGALMLLAQRRRQFQTSSL